jgi:hypothetical protein
MSDYWFSRVFHCYLALGKGHDQKLFEWGQWNKISPCLDRLFSRPDTLIETVQFDPATDRAIPFRNLGWNSKSHAKWTLNSPITSNLPTSREFLTTQLWAPGQRICEEKETAPDIFAEISSFGAEAFDEGIIIAVAEDLNIAVDCIFKLIVAQMSPVLIARQHVPWGETIGNGIGYTNCISDLMDVGIPRHIKNISPSDIRGNWSTFF